jgi:hypothetical protein
MYMYMKGKYTKNPLKEYKIETINIHLTTSTPNSKLRHRQWVGLYLSRPERSFYPIFSFGYFIFFNFVFLESLPKMLSTQKIGFPKFRLSPT